jgi:hypothetical protein
MRAQNGSQAVLETQAKLRHNGGVLIRQVANSILSLLVVATFLWGGCVSCEQYFMFPGKHQPCCNKSGQCERPGKTSQTPQKQDCNRLPLARTGNAHVVPLPAILPDPIKIHLAQGVPSPDLSLAFAFELRLDPSPPDQQVLHSTFLI